MITNTINRVRSDIQQIRPRGPAKIMVEREALVAWETVNARIVTPDFDDTPAAPLVTGAFGASTSGAKIFICFFGVIATATTNDGNGNVSFFFSVVAVVVVVVLVPSFSSNRGDGGDGGL